MSGGSLFVGAIFACVFRLRAWDRYACESGGSLGYVAVIVTERVEHAEGHRQQTDAQQVAQRCQIRNRRVVRVHAPQPHPVDHDVGGVQQQCHLNTKINLLTP